MKITNDRNQIVRFNLLWLKMLRKTGFCKELVQSGLFFLTILLVAGNSPV